MNSTSTTSPDVAPAEGPLVNFANHYFEMGIPLGAPVVLGGRELSIALVRAEANGAAVYRGSVTGSSLRLLQLDEWECQLLDSGNQCVARGPILASGGIEIPLNSDDLASQSVCHIGFIRTTVFSTSDKARDKELKFINERLQLQPERSSALRTPHFVVTVEPGPTYGEVNVELEGDVQWKSFGNRTAVGLIDGDGMLQAVNRTSHRGQVRFWMTGDSASLHFVADVRTQRDVDVLDRLNDASAWQLLNFCRDDIEDEVLRSRVAQAADDIAEHLRLQRAIASGETVAMANADVRDRFLSRAGIRRFQVKVSRDLQADSEQRLPEVITTVPFADVVDGDVIIRGSAADIPVPLVRLHFKDRNYNRIHSCFAVMSPVIDGRSGPYRCYDVPLEELGISVDDSDDEELPFVYPTPATPGNLSDFPIDEVAAFVCSVQDQVDRSTLMELNAFVEELRHLSPMAGSGNADTESDANDSSIQTDRKTASEFVQLFTALRHPISNGEPSTEVPAIKAAVQDLEAVFPGHLARTVRQTKTASSGALADAAPTTVRSDQPQPLTVEINKSGSVYVGGDNVPTPFVQLLVYHTESDELIAGWLDALPLARGRRSRNVRLPEFVTTRCHDPVSELDVVAIVIPEDLVPSVVTSVEIDQLLNVIDEAAESGGDGLTQRNRNELVAELMDWRDSIAG